MKRISRIYYWWLDPFDNKLLCEGSLGYDKRLSSENYYTKFLKGMKCKFVIPCYKELQGRDPKLILKIV